MHIMLDIETWGVLPGSAIRSIGAVGFELGGNISAAFYHNIDDQSCLDAGLVKDARTEKWWSEQSQEAQDFLMVDPQPLAVVLSELYSWFTSMGGEQVWAQGAAFDTVLVEHAMRATGIKVPWKFWNVRDTRTAYEIAGLDYHAVERVGVAHSAIDDCKHQVKLVCMAVVRIGK